METLDLLARKSSHDIRARALITLYSTRSEFGKAMAEEIRLAKKPHSTVPSSRSSTDSRVASPAPRNVPVSKETPTSVAMDYVYLKNVLLQFLEQKDKNHQKQLIPVLGMLLHFDKYAIPSVTSGLG